jgi:homoprotocatechuate degradation regulator HpaR
MSSPSGRKPQPPGTAFERRNLPLLLLQAREGVLDRFRPNLNAHGVTEQQWRVVRALVENGPMEPRQIGRICRISSPSLAGVLARMEDIDMVKRERLAQDQRRVMVSLTDRSRTLASAMAPKITALYAALESQVGSALLQRLEATLDELIDLLGDGPENDGS